MSQKPSLEETQQQMANDSVPPEKLHSPLIPLMWLVIPFLIVLGIGFLDS